MMVACLFRIPLLLAVTIGPALPWALAPGNAFAQQGPSLSVPAEKEPEEAARFPELRANESLFFDPANKVPEAERDAVSAALAEHRDAGGEILKIAVLETPPEGLDPEHAAERVFAEWQKDPMLLKERDALVVIFTGTGTTSVQYSYDLEHLLEGTRELRIRSRVDEALALGAGMAAAAGAVELLRALSSPLVDQGRVPPRLQTLMAPPPERESSAFAWVLITLGLVGLGGFVLLLSYQEIHLSSEGPHRVRPHEQLRILARAAKARFGERAAGSPDAASTGEW